MAASPRGSLSPTELTPLRTVLVGNRIAAGLLLAGGLIVVVGMVDDRWGLSPISKLAGQAAAGGILFWSGCQLSWLPEPGGGTFLLTPNESTVLTIFLVVATINAVNFIDGLDGLAAGIVCIAAIAFFVYYYRLTQVVHPHLSEQAGPGARVRAAGRGVPGLPAAQLLSGQDLHGRHRLDAARAAAGLRPDLEHRLARPRAACTRPSNRFPEVLPLLLPATILVIPYTDLLLAVTRRVRAGKSPLAPDRKHLHHRLQDMGHPHRASVLILYLWAALFSAAIVWLSIARTPLFVFAVTTVVAIAGAAADVDAEAALVGARPPARQGRRHGCREAAGGRPAARPDPAAGNGSARPAAGNGGAPRPATRRRDLARPGQRARVGPRPARADAARSDHAFFGDAYVGVPASACPLRPRPAGTTSSRPGCGGRRAAARRGRPRRTRDRAPLGTAAQPRG